MRGQTEAVRKVFVWHDIADLDSADECRKLIVAWRNRETGELKTTFGGHLVSDIGSWEPTHWTHMPRHPHWMGDSAPLPLPAPHPPGWIVVHLDGRLFRVLRLAAGHVLPGWTDDRDDAWRFARREDARRLMDVLEQHGYAGWEEQAL